MVHGSVDMKRYNFIVRVKTRGSMSLYRSSWLLASWFQIKNLKVFILWDGVATGPQGLHREH